MRWQKYATGLGMLALLSGCASKFTRENFALVREGDTREAVVERLGQPEKIIDGEWIYSHPDTLDSAIVSFNEQGLVANAEWFGGLGGD